MEQIYESRDLEMKFVTIQPSSETIIIPQKGDIVLGVYNLELSVGEKRLIMPSRTVKLQNHIATITTGKLAFRKAPK